MITYFCNNYSFFNVQHYHTIQILCIIGINIQVSSRGSLQHSLGSLFLKAFNNQHSCHLSLDPHLVSWLLRRRSVPLVLVGLLHRGWTPRTRGVEWGVSRMLSGAPLILGVVLLQLHRRLGDNTSLLVTLFVMWALIADELLHIYLGVAHLCLVLEPAEVLLLVGRVTCRVHRRLRLGLSSKVTLGLVTARTRLKYDRGWEMRGMEAETWILFLVKKPNTEYRVVMRPINNE